MKKFLKLLCVLSTLAAVMTFITACGQWGDTYEKLDAEGYSVSVRYDANGGVFANTQDVFVVDVFNLNQMPTDAKGNKYTYLLPPDDGQRGNPNFTVSNTGHFLAGWYEERTPRVNDAGDALDEYGQLCSVSGKAQGYIYSKPWDFSKPLTLDPNGSYNAGENYLTLYAAWIPTFTFEFYVEGDDGCMTLAATTEGIELALPEWNTSTGKLDMKKFPALEDKTFESAFLDEAMTEAAPAVLTGEWDPATGVATMTTVKVYTTWLDGTWYKIYNAKQFKDNSRLNGNYILCADLDFAGEVWAPALTTGKFTGQIQGNGHKISNVTVEQADTKQEMGGIFGALAASASITDVTFENITYKIGGGSLKPHSYFGLLTGEMTEGAVLENVTLTGELIVGKNIYAGGNYSVGLVCGNDADHGIDVSGITAVAEDGASATVTVEEGSDRVVISFGG